MMRGIVGILGRWASLVVAMFLFVTGVMLLFEETSVLSSRSLKLTGLNMSLAGLMLYLGERYVGLLLIRIESLENRQAAQEQYLTMLKTEIQLYKEAGQEEADRALEYFSRYYQCQERWRRLSEMTAEKLN